MNFEFWVLSWGAGTLRPVRNQAYMSVAGVVDRQLDAQNFLALSS